MFGLEFELLMTVPNRTQERYAENCRYRPAEVLFDDGRAFTEYYLGGIQKERLAVSQLPSALLPT
jgi:hypothetical protein